MDTLPDYAVGDRVAYWFTYEVDGTATNSEQFSLTY
jgi:hypothetical protein